MMKQAHIQEIQTLPLFSDLADEHFDHLIKGAYLQTFPPQVELITEGEHADFLYILVDGMVELFSQWEQNTTTMAILRPISHFILAATITDDMYLMSGRTLEKSRIMLIPSEDVRYVFDHDIHFARSVVREQAAIKRLILKRLKDVKLRNATERLANYILRHQRYSGMARSFNLPIEKRILASYLGMTPENLSRAFKTLGEHGLSIQGNKVIMVDEAKLTAYAQPTPLIDGAESEYYEGVSFDDDDKA